MFEVIPHPRDPSKWLWRLISFCGRVLVYDLELMYDDSLVAAKAAIAYRKQFFSNAERIDSGQYEGERPCHSC